jgi:hypothetical protein
MDDDILMTKIRVICKSNQEIIDRIQAQGTEEKKSSIVSIVSYDVTLQPNTMDIPEYKVNEISEQCLGIDVVKAWRNRIELRTPIDLFNDKLDYKCDSFDDVVRLNDSMSRVIEKYSFLDPKRAASELQKFKENFEILQTCLGEIDQVFCSVRQESRLIQYRTEVEEINQRFRKLYSNPDICIRKIDNWSTPCTSHTVVNRTAKLISGQFGCLLSKNGYKFGVHKWHLRMISRTSTCMVGVAPDTVSKTGVINNYNTNGFYMDLNSGLLYSGPPMSKNGKSGLGKGIASGILTVTLHCTNRTLTYTYEGQDYVAYTDLPMDKKLYLAWDNNTTAGSEIELM